MEGANVGSLSHELLGNHKVIFLPCFIELTLSENRSSFLWVNQHQCFMAQDCHKGHLLSLPPSLLPFFPPSLPPSLPDGASSGWLLQGMTFWQPVKGMWMVWYLIFFAFLFAAHFFLHNSVCTYTLQSFWSKTIPCSCWNSWWKPIVLLVTLLSLQKTL